MALQVFVTKSDDSSVIPGAHRVEGGTPNWQVHTCTHTHIVKKCKTFF